MKNKGKLRLVLYRLFSFMTFHKYYICEDCNKIHKRTGNEFEVGSGHIYVSIDCLPEEEMATRSSILAWEIPWTEEPGELQSMGSQRVRHDLVD